MDRHPSQNRPYKPAGAAVAVSLLLLAAVPAGAAERSAAEIAKSHCARCHEAGAAGAPKPGDKAAWASRLTLGVDVLVLSAIRGHGGMPPRGGMANLTDDELRGAVLYLFNPAGPPKAPPKSAKAVLPPGAGPHRVTSGGMDVYFGLVSAARMRDYPAGSLEAKMHGGVPGGRGYYHVNVSLFDSATQTPVTGASVELDYEQVGLGRQSRDLEAVAIAGGTSHGAYIRLAPKADYVFRVRVRKPGSAEAIEAKFQERMN